MKTRKVCIIGGGSAGLAAGIMLARMAERMHKCIYITIIDHEKRVGKKLLATGNGRCNLTNIVGGAERYHSGYMEAVERILNCFPPEKAIAFFESLGVVCRQESEGRIYPASGQASSVLDSLRLECERLKIEIVTNVHVTSLICRKEFFEMSGKDQESGSQRIWNCDRVIMATGGKASPHLGSDGSGFSIMETLGHYINPLYPSLVQLNTNVDLLGPLKGIKIEGKASILQHNTCLRSEFGEILFTEYGLSGPPILLLSEIVGNISGHNHNVTLQVSLDMLPEWEPEQLRKDVGTRIDAQGYRSLEMFFVGWLHKRLGIALFKAAHIAPLSRPANSLNEQEVKRICHVMKDWRIDVKGNRPFSHAQVTGGGLALDQFSDGLESLQVQNLFAVGEILDVHGDCGGYNLQWAWASAYCAAKATVQSL